MRKLFTLLTALMISAYISASDTFQFCYQDGTIIPSGSTITADKMEEDPFFGDKMIVSGVYVINTSEDYANVNLSYTINSIPNGSLQVCFPENCFVKDKPGTYDNGTGELRPGEIKSMQTEWLPIADGICSVTFTISEVSLGKIECSTITVNFQNGKVAKETIWGYYSGDGKDLKGLGANTKSYNMAIFVPGDGILKGGKISGLQIPVADGTCVSKITGWVANKLATTMSYSTTKDLTPIPAGQMNNPKDIYGTVTFDTPIEVPAEGCYVGYSITLSSIVSQGGKYPLLLDGTTLDNNGCYAFLNTWQNLGGQYGVSGLKVILLDVDQPAAAAVIEPIDRAISVANSQNEFTATIVSNGSEDVKSIEYVVDINGKTTTNTATLNIPAGFSQKGNATIKVNAPAEAQNHTVKMYISKVNDIANAYADNVTYINITNALRKVDRNSVVEQFTGTNCGFCPIGHATMHNFREAFGDRFVGIAIHQYSGSPAIDAMFIKNYRTIPWDAAPSALLDGVTMMDSDFLIDGSGKYESVLDDFKEHCDKPALADIDFTAKWTNGEQTSVQIDANIEALTIGQYSVAYVLLADSLHGSSTSFRQTNYLSEYTPAQFGTNDPELKKYLIGGEYSQSYLFPYFMDVAVASSYNSSGSNLADDLGIMNAGDKKSNSYKLTLPATPNLLVNSLNANKHNIYAAVIVFAPDGSIANAKRIKVTNAGLKGDANNDGTVDVADITTIATYILQGSATPFNFDNADVNSDGNIDVSDITGTASIILGQ